MLMARVAPSRAFIPPLTCLVVLYSQGAVALAAARGTAPSVQARVGHAVRVDREPRIDGRLDEVDWAQAPASSGFLQREPRNGERATQNTEVRVVYTARTLVIGAKLHQSQRTPIVATEYRRDADLDADDTFEVFLDTFHDRRNAFYFQTNPLGAQRDGLIRNEGDDINWQWDGIWSVATSRDDDGWSVEMAIPFSTLRFAGDGSGGWGVNFGRRVAAAREESYFVPISRDFGFFGKWRVSAFATLEGLAGVAAPARVQVWPYGLGGWDRDYENRIRTPNGATAGFGVDAKVALGSLATVDLTYRTDFAQVESDQQQVNLTRFPLFFPEKRTFFLENAGLFRVGERSQPFEPPTTLLFFSRRIGLSEDGEVVVPILGGVRGTGKLGKWDVGAFDIATDAVQLDESSRLPRTNFAAVRVKRDILARSSVGALYLAKTPAEEGPSNQVFAFDGSLAFGESFNIIGFAAASVTPGLSRAAHVVNVDAAVNKDRWGWNAVYADIGEDFNAEMGFLQRTGIRKGRVNGYLGRRPDWPGVRQVFAIGDATYVTDRRGALQTLTAGPGMGIIFNDGAMLFGSVLRNAEGLTEAFEVRDGVEIPTGTYWSHQVAVQYAGNRSRRVSFSGGLVAGGFYGGRIFAPTLSTDVRVHRRLVLGVLYSYNAIDVPVPGGRFETSLAVARATLAFSTRAYLQALVQRDDESKQTRANVVFRWTCKPGADLFVVYDDTRGLGGVQPQALKRRFLVKMVVYLVPGR